MKKNLRVIQINGLRGIFLALFIVTCLAAGFIFFPALVAMHTWNFLAAEVSFTSINFIQGLLLWGIVVTSVLILNKKRFIISFAPPDDFPELSEYEAKQVLERFKSQSQIIDITELAKKIAQDSEVPTERDDMTEEKQEDFKE